MVALFNTFNEVNEPTLVIFVCAAVLKVPTRAVPALPMNGELTAPVVTDVSAYSVVALRLPVEILPTVKLPVVLMPFALNDAMLLLLIATLT